MRRFDKDSTLGSFEQVVLLSLARLEGPAHGMAVRRELEQATRRAVTIGAVYATLDRLEQKGLLASDREPPAPGAGGPTRRYFRIRPAGRRALLDSRALLDRLWQGVSLVRGND